MSESSTNNSRIDRTAVAIGLALFVGGIALNYFLERHNTFKLWENSDYPISWADLLYPPICVLLCLTGIVLFLNGAFCNYHFLRSLRSSVIVALLPTALYAAFVFGMQFIATGADRLGECPGLDQAAASSGVIPESLWMPHHPAVGCGVERRGIFLSYYNDIAVIGVTDAGDQQHVLDAIARQHRDAHTHPVQVSFLDKQYVSTREGARGVTLRTRTGPSKLLRIANIE